MGVRHARRTLRYGVALGDYRDDTADELAHDREHTTDEDYREDDDERLDEDTDLHSGLGY
jgi:hypothetical protein